MHFSSYSGLQDSIYFPYTVFNLRSKAFDDQIKISSLLNFNKTNKNILSTFNVEVNSDDPKIILGILAEHNIYDESIQGELSANLTSSFDIDSIENAKIDLHLTKFNIERDNISLKAENLGKILEVENGSVRKLKVNFSGKENILKVDGEGQFNRNFKIKGSSSMSANLLELLTDKIIDSFVK